ncbi:nucleoredoxin isoform X2 [Chlorocebus sabaeus]|uniref:nucleoredoxin isoform X2 n=1 Tax=Chlorocebus sabaeus TaxID=60711 RepID=UPI0018B0E0F7|nr:nucleoredoxin isoform X2 [Chlorocebus sabaeus]
MSGFLEELLGEKLVTGGGEEVDVHSLGARGISLLGLYFGCSLSAPCAQLSASLAAFYGRLRGDAAAGPGPGAGAGAAAEPEPRRRLEIVFVSSDQDQRQWQDFVRDMPWLALPYKEKHRKLKLWNKYRISNIPSLIFLDATTGKVVCRNGLLVIRDDPEGLEFPWGPKPFREVIAGPLLRNNGQSLESSSLEGSHVGVYFSAHWCPPCRSLTRVLVESYRKIKEAGQSFEIIFVSADRSEESFKQYFSEMPWLAVPYTDEARRSRLNRLYGIQGAVRTPAASMAWQKEQQLLQQTHSASHAGAHAGRPRGLPRQQGLWFTPVLITARSQKHQLWGRTLPGGLWEGPVVTGGAPVRPAVPVAAPGPGFFWAAVSRPAPEPRGWTQLAWTPASGDKMQP